jgi:ribosomal protein L40E
MALIRCPECGKGVSSRAGSCPQCECPVAAPAVIPATSAVSQQGEPPAGQSVAPSHQSGQTVAEDSMYTQLSQMLQKPVGEILSFLEMMIEVGALATDSFVMDFLAAANGFTERCCSSCAELLRHSSRLPEVRATPTVTLANQIRAEVFLKCDAILEQCRQHLQAGVNAIARVPSQEPGLISTALQGAATGQLAAGLGRHGKTLGTVGAVLAVGEQWSRRTALLAAQLDAAEQAQAAARGKIPEYLGAMIPGLCQDLFDYGCAKCLGAEIDFKAQEEALDKFGGFIREHQAKLDRALKVDADRRREKEERALKAVSAERAEQQKSVENATGRSFKRCGWYLIGLSILFIAAGVGAMLDPSSVGAGIFVFTVAAVMLAAGIRLSWGKKKPQQAGERFKSPIASAESQWLNVGSIAQRGPREVQLPQPPEGWICGEYKGESFFSNGHIVVKGEPPQGHHISSQSLPGDLFASFQIIPDSERPVSADAFSIDSEGVEVIWFTNGTRIDARYYDFLLSHHPDAQFLSAGRESPLKAIDRSGNIVGAVMPLKKAKPPPAVKELLRQVGKGAALAATASAQAKVCAYCGRENLLDAAQCRECGTTGFKPVEQQSAPRQ